MEHAQRSQEKVSRIEYGNENFQNPTFVVRRWTNMLFNHKRLENDTLDSVEVDRGFPSANYYLYIQLYRHWSWKWVPYKELYSWFWTFQVCITFHINVTVIWIFENFAYPWILSFIFNILHIDNEIQSFWSIIYSSGNTEVNKSIIFIEDQGGRENIFLTAFLQHELSSAAVSLLRLNDSAQYVKTDRQYDWIYSINTISDILLPHFEYIPLSILKNLHFIACTSWVIFFLRFQ